MDTLGIILPAAGFGKRMKKEVPKPYLEIAGEPLIKHTVRKLLEFEPATELTVASAAEWKEYTAEILGPLGESSGVQIQVVEGGARRQDSVFNALQVLPETDLVAVHDAVRPFVSVDLLDRCCKKALEKGAAIPGIPVRDTIKVINEDQSIRETPDRRYLWRAQTPQVFRTDLFRRVFREAAAEEVTGTDDASFVEWAGHPVYVVEGSRDNFKVTYPPDLERAARLLEKVR